MPKQYLLGVDVGTYSSKGVLVDADTGEVFASHVIEHGLSMPKPGWVEHDADKIWWGEFAEISRQLLATTNIDPRQVKGVGASAIGSCVLPIDEDGNPLRQGILYGIDTRASEEIEQLEKAIGREKIFQQSGYHLSSVASGAKILWIKNKEPEVYAKARWFLTSQAYIVYRLTRQPSADMFIAGFFAPLMDVEKKCWIEEVGRLITPIENMPKMYWSCDVVGTVTAEAAKITGLAEGTPVITGTSDVAAEAISAGVANIGDMLMMMGSSTCFLMKTANLIRTEHYWTANWMEPNTYCFCGCTTTSGSLTRWFRDNLGQEEIAAQAAGGENAYAAMAKLLKDSPPGAKGLIVLPYFEGERVPLHDPNAKGLFFGLTLNHTRADIYRGILEGVALSIRHNIDVMHADGVKAQRIIGVGGGTKNMEWMQMISDIANVEMIIPEQQIGASYGDAFMAGVGVSIFKDLSEITKWVRTKYHIRPNLDNWKKYEPHYKIYRNLYEQTKGSMRELSALYRG
jgi:xylulokinase